MASTVSAKKSQQRKKEKKIPKDVENGQKMNWSSLLLCLVMKRNCFASNLEKLALKKSSNNEVFTHIKKLFDQVLQDPSFREQNNRNNFVLKDGTALKYVNIDTSVEKLRRKYANLKTEWRKLRDRVKLGSGLSPKNEPRWYKYMNPIFSETNEDIDLAAESADVSYMENFGENPGNDSCPESESSILSDDESSNFSAALSSKSKSLLKRLRSTPTSESEEEHADAEETESSSCTKTCTKPGKVVAAPHQKRKAVRSQQQALSHLASNVEQIASVQMKKHKLSLESDLKREHMYLKFKQEELERNRKHEEKMATRTREHEIQMAEIYVTAMSANPNQGSNYFPPPPTNMHLMSTPMQHNAMTAANFGRPYAAAFTPTSMPSPVRYDMQNNENSQQNSYSGSNDSYHGFNSPH